MNFIIQFSAFFNKSWSNIYTMNIIQVDAMRVTLERFRGLASIAIDDNIPKKADAMETLIRCLDIEIVAVRLKNTIFVENL